MGKYINENTLYKTVLKLLNNKLTDKTHFVKYLINNHSEDVEFMMNMLTEDNIQLFNRNDYFKTEINKKDLDELYNFDRLKDLGLLSEDNMLYGQVITVDTWRDIDINYAISLKVKIFCHTNDGKEISFWEDTVNTLDIIKVKRSDIPYFKNKKL